MMGWFEPGWLHFETKRVMPRFWPSRSSGSFNARAGSSLLLLRSSGSFDAQAWFSISQYFTLQSVCSSDIFFYARACDLLILSIRSSGEFYARADTIACKTSGSVQSTLERLFSRSSVSLCLTLERGFLRSSGESTTSVRDFTFWITF